MDLSYLKRPRHEQLRVGFVWTLETIKQGVVVDRERVHNLVPEEGLHYLINAGLRNGTPFANWYIGIYEGNYVPVPGDTAATFIAAATELTAYSETTRRPLTLAAPVGGATDNSAARAEFTGTTNGKQALGGFIISTATKGAASGVLASAVRFPSPRPLDAGTILRATAGFSFVSI